MVLPASSFAVHFIVVVPIGNVPVYDTLPSASIETVTLSELSLDTLNSVTSQLSVAVGFDITMPDASHETFSISLIPLITGFSLSSTVTVCLHSLFLPFTSVTVQRTVCVPLSSVAVNVLFNNVTALPSSVALTLWMPQLSETSGVRVTSAEHSPLSVFTTIVLSAQSIVGATPSTTVNSRSHLLFSPRHKSSTVKIAL